MDPQYHTKFHTAVDGPKDRPYFIGPSGHIQGSNRRNHKTSLKSNIARPVQTLQELFVGNRNDIRGTGYCRCWRFVMSGLSFLKLTMIEHIKIMQIPLTYGQCFSGQDPDTIQVTSLDPQRSSASSNTFLEENNLLPIIYRLFSEIDFNS